MAYQKAFLYECTSVQFPGNHSITTNDLDLEQKIKGIIKGSYHSLELNS